MGTISSLATQLFNKDTTNTVVTSSYQTRHTDFPRQNLLLDSHTCLRYKEAHMPRIDLQVPITEKDAVKHLGALWDPQNKTWYVPDGIDATPLQKWIPVRCPPTSQRSTGTWRGAHASADAPELLGNTQGQRMIASVLLEDAARALEQLGQGDDPGYAGIHSGISALDALLEDPSSPFNLPGPDLMAAAQCLLTQAAEGELPFDIVDRERASALAGMLWIYTPSGF